MKLQHLSISNFKNIEEASLDFSPSINCLLGDNGMGKTNLLDAIHFLSYARSFSGQQDSRLIRHEAPFMMLRGVYERRGTAEELTASIVPGKRKVLKRKGKEYERLSDHIGLFPLVMIAPGDTVLIEGAAEERRRMMDVVISQSDPQYLQALIRYNRSMQQRNRLLADRAVDHTLYLAVEMAMTMAAGYIHKARVTWLEQFIPLFADFYRAIAGEGEVPELTLQAHLSRTPDLQELLDGARRHDEIVGHTSVGPHRDDLVMTLDGLPARRAASQGQAKTMTVALRLAQYEFLRRASGLNPILLLDDIFDKLDRHRVANIIAIVRDGQRFGQIFITDTNRQHLDEIMQLAGTDYKLWIVERGTFRLWNGDEPAD